MKTNSMGVRIKPTKEVLDLIKKSINKCGSSKEFANRFSKNIYESIYDWKTGRVYIPLYVVEKCCEILNKDFWGFLEGKRIYSRSRISSVLFKRRINPTIANLVMWVVHDGSLPKSNRSVDVYQKSKVLLKILADKFAAEFSISKQRFHFYKDKRREFYKLMISCSPLQYILNKYFGIPLGKKCFSVTIPKQIMESSDKKILLATLAASIDSDGSIGLITCSGIISPRISIGSSSSTLIKQVMIILKKLGVKHFYSYNNKGMMHSVIIMRFNHVVKILYLLKPYMLKNNNSTQILALKETKYRTIMRSLLDQKKAKSIIEKVFKKFGSYPKVAEWLKEKGYNVSYKSVWRWGAGKRKVPIYAVKLFCGYLEEDFASLFPYWAYDYVNYITKEDQINK